MALPGTDRFVSYGASASEGGHHYRVPFTIHGVGNVPTTSAKINGDALPRTGAGSPRVPDLGPGGLPQARRQGPGLLPLLHGHPPRRQRPQVHRRRLVGHGEGPFTPAANPLVCPTKGDRWALDADVARGPKGGIWFTWRDGQRADGPESALSVMRLKFDEHHRVSGAAHPGSSCAATTSPGRTSATAAE